MSHEHSHEPYEPLEQAQQHYLRVWCNRFISIIETKALAGDQDAVKLLIFSERAELQTPVNDELRISDFWDAMIQLARFAPGGSEALPPDTPPGDPGAS